MTWEQLATELGTTPDDLDLIHVVVDGRRFFLTRSPLGSCVLVVAHAEVARDGDLSAREASLAAAAWPVGGMILHQGRWLIRHAFVGHPRATDVVEILRCLTTQASLLRHLRRQVATATLAHYAD